MVTPKFWRDRKNSGNTSSRSTTNENTVNKIITTKWNASLELHKTTTTLSRIALAKNLIKTGEIGRGRRFEKELDNLQVNLT